MSGNAITLKANLDMNSWINHTGKNSLNDFLYNNQSMINIHVVMSAEW